MKRRTLAGVLLAAVALSASAGCTGSSKAAGVGVDVDGEAEIIEPGHDVRGIDGRATLRTGQRLRVVRGTATVELPREAQLELRNGSELELRTGDNGSGVQPVLQAGDLLVTSGRERAPVEVMGTTVRVVSGTARLSRGLSLLVGAYRGTADVASGGRAITVPALRQVVVPAVGLLPARPSPYVPTAGDAWDLRFLGDAIELGDQLTSRSRGFTGQAQADQRTSVAFYRKLFPGLDGEPLFDALFDPNRPPGETLVGTAIVLEAKGGGFPERWAAVFGFRDEGASWGLVALDRGVSRVPVLAAIDAAIGRTVTETPPPPPPLPPVTVTTPPPVTPTTRPPVTRPGATTKTTVPTGATAPPGPEPGTGPLNTGLPLDQTVNSLVDTLSGLLKGLGR